MRPIILFAAMLMASSAFAQHKPVTHHHKQQHLVRPRVVLERIPTIPERHFYIDVAKYEAEFPIFITKPTTQTADILALSRCTYRIIENGEFLNTIHLKNLPYTNINDIVSLTAGVYQQKRGAPVCVDGGRGDGNVYIIDGMYALRN